jgi:Fe-S-cluster containining protein
LGGLSPGEIAANRIAVENGLSPFDRDLFGHRPIFEIETIADMVIPLGALAMSPSGIPCDPPVWYYRCRHQLPSGDCGIYDTRPNLCRAYPYGRPCEYPGCTCEEARQGVMGKVANTLGPVAS